MKLERVRRVPGAVAEIEKADSLDGDGPRRGQLLDPVGRRAERRPALARAWLMSALRSAGAREMQLGLGISNTIVEFLLVGDARTRWKSWSASRPQYVIRPETRNTVFSALFARESAGLSAGAGSALS